MLIGASYRNSCGKQEERFYSESTYLIPERRERTPGFVKRFVAYFVAVSLGIEIQEDFVHGFPPLPDPRVRKHDCSNSPTSTWTKMEPRVPVVEERPRNSAMFWYVSHRQVRGMSATNSRLAAKAIRHAGVECVRGLWSANPQPQLTGPEIYRDLHPETDPMYVSVPQTANWKIMREVNSSVSPPAVVTTYDNLFWRVSHMFVSRGTYQSVLFVGGDVMFGRILINYTGHRVRVDLSVYFHYVVQTFVTTTRPFSNNRSMSFSYLVQPL